MTTLQAKMKNARYKLLNDRFEARSQQLRELGFKYVLLQEFGFDAAVFTRPKLGRKIPSTIQSSSVMHADDVIWDDIIADLP